MLLNLLFQDLHSSSMQNTNLCPFPHYSSPLYSTPVSLESTTCVRQAIRDTVSLLFVGLSDKTNICMGVKLGLTHQGKKIDEGPEENI
jgi:hypothetical protein